MIRRPLLPAIVAAAALVLGACSSASDTPSDSGSSVSEPAGDSGDGAASEDTDAASDEGDSADADESTPDEDTVTLDGDMDAQSAAWFSQMCDGAAPMLEAVIGATGAMMGSAGGGDAAAAQAAQAQLVQSFNAASESMSAAADKLSSLPPPSVEHGDEIAKKTAEAMASAGPALKQLAEQVGAADVSSMEDLSQAMNAANEALEAGLAGISVDGFELSDELQAQVAALPSCAPLMSLSSLSDSE